MKADFIRVTRRRMNVWSVFRGKGELCLLSFKLKPHAIAYARAIALSRRLTLFIDDRNGLAVRQSSSSLTYPVVLD
jgi:hypothetical protein